MKKSLIVLALLAASAAHAQVVVDGAAEARSQAAAQAAAGAASQAGAVGNAINYSATYNTVTPDVQTLRQEGTVTSNQNVRYSGTVENRASGGYNNVDTQNVNYSGTQTLKNVPGIAMSGPASGPCTGVSGGVSAAGPGWGLGFNGSAVMVDCRLRENARVLGMAMQSFDGATNPQEKGEVTVMFMDSLRALAGYTDKLVSDEKIPSRGRPQPK